MAATLKANDKMVELARQRLANAGWLDRANLHCGDATQLPYDTGRMNAVFMSFTLELFDTPEIPKVLSECHRVLRPGGRIVLCEPYISPVSRFVYQRFHPEPVDMAADPLGAAIEGAVAAKDPFDSNQAIPTLLFGRNQGRDFVRMFPLLSVLRVERTAGLSYPASGGFSHGPFLPRFLWQRLFAIENLLPEVVFRAIGFRMIVVLERRS